MSNSPDRLTRPNVPAYLLETWSLRCSQQPFFDGSEADHGGVNADQALALDTAALLKGSA